MLSKYRLEHASHNYETCQYLKDAESFNDWVITTAFYSALHYCRYKLFPVLDKAEKISIRNFECFCSKVNSSKDKHAVLDQLIKEKVPSIHLDYRILKNECWTSRYKNYQVGRQSVKDSLESLEKIKKFCERKKDCIKVDRMEDFSALLE